jgi:protein-L-isoaspartate(D-aspartate) O-methyltransferase
VTNDELIVSLEKDGALKTERIVDAFRAVDRQLFVPAEYKHDAYRDAPLPLTQGATISQPYTVAVMLEALQPQLGEHCLDIGAGSGWVSALLAALVGLDGQVIAVERLALLAVAAKRALASCGVENVMYIVGDAHNGWPDEAPYDCIHVAAATNDTPKALIDQLAMGGRLIIPVGEFVQELVLITKISDTRTTERRIPGFQFVSLVTR